MGLLVKMPLNADLKRFPKFAESDFVCLDVLRPRLDDLVRCRELSRLLLDIVPGNAVMTGGSALSAFTGGDEKEEELERLSGGVGGAFGPMCFWLGGAVFGG